MEGAGISPENALCSFTSEQIKKPDQLPEKLSSVNYDVEAGEKLKLDFVLEQIKDVSRSVRSKTQERFVILGSMGMYALFNQLRPAHGELSILEQRISRGKNDYDIGVLPGTIEKVKTDFGWDVEAKKMSRGTISEKGQIIDLMERRELPHFPWQEVELDDEKIPVQAPEHMIFEKMDALNNPGLDDDGQERLAEIKWGVDIKLLKSYLVLSLGKTEEEVDLYLATRWVEYQADTRYASIAPLTERISSGTPVDQVIREALQSRLPGEVVNLESQLVGMFGQGSELTVKALMNSQTAQDFDRNLKTLIDKRQGPFLGYDEAKTMADQAYKGLLNDQSTSTQTTLS